MTQFLQRSAQSFFAICLATTVFSAAALSAGSTLAATHHRPKAEEPPKAANGKIVTVKGDRASYIVKKGDTLEKIADKLDTTVDELMSANKLKKGAVLQPGDVIKGPAVAKKAYVVVPGDTVFSIAKRFHVTVDDLRAENDLSARTSIRPGQQIRLPGDYRAPEVESAEDQSDAPKGKKGEKTEVADAEPPAKGSKGHRGAKPAAAESDETGTAAAADRANAGKVITREAKGESYKVRSGDTIAKVADRLDTDVGTLKRLNHLKGNAVHAGQVLRGPSFAEHYYVAEAGDTLTGIAGRFSVSVANLRAENELSKRVISVRPGTKVFLPDGYRDRTEVAQEAPPTRYPRPYQPGEATPPSRPIPYAQVPGAAAPPTPPAAAPAYSDTQVTQMAAGRFKWPLTGAVLSDFGPKPNGQHNDGVDIQAKAGDPVRAAADGEIAYAGDQLPGFGNLVLIKHADGWATAYGHLGRIDVKNQQKVTQGQQIGQAGQTGGVSEPQLHFEVRYQAKAVDPKLALPKP
ncbi:LysM peptidoglycan-binding domain-containing protein [Phenylobacterium sp.]|uniref:LysM peptidoglycan-binding domain-containing protein n=1 Tax=Phenylobacterium sp. TaxID=1871053 RepID=UPI002F3E6CCF